MKYFFRQGLVDIIFWVLPNVLTTVVQIKVSAECSIILLNVSQQGEKKGK